MKPTNALDKIGFFFQKETAAWAPVLQAHAMNLFKVLLIGSIAWMGISGVLKQEEMQNILISFVKLLFHASLMLALLKYYKEWANMLISGLSQIAVHELRSPALDPQAVFVTGMKLVSAVLGEMSFYRLIDNVGLIICALAILLSFALIAAQMLLVKCEAYIVLNAGIILLGFGGAEQTRSYATNFMRYSLGIALKLFVMQLLVGIGTSFINELPTGDLSMQDIFFIIGVAIVLLALTMSIPDIVSGIINGSHVSTGSAITSAASTVAMGTMATMGAMKAGGFGAFDAGQATRAAAQMADIDGATGLGKAGHIMKTLGSGALSTRTQGRMQNIRSAVEGKKELQDLMKSATPDAPPPTTGNSQYESPAVDLTTSNKNS
ncbi:P-type conjugative transfer protein TrbL [Halodesulfovibrio sp.]|jgi:type IV secretion system protein TrbL|uniref:P-type conjugative transfer protein TrbL n=1 Tax=Halodesulfovibrio sp. TaxID=1912772 RepID=UPI0025F36A3E|nr:P-type conjugative transfer protein TrbL [Halodesulfovibrio sp.]MCT4625653.1 P-type conjugative transfer protein TrbL [Halodesulfovibrio sp.]